ncbi:hypothetical protein AGMMS49574_23220 [Bacteroidia bacterium]|nr:hypothetical protein AGMMS49574_23220 [Bacteroidia bacterium]
MKIFIDMKNLICITILTLIILLSTLYFIYKNANESDIDNFDIVTEEIIPDDFEDMYNLFLIDEDDSIKKEYKSKEVILHEIDSIIARCKKDKDLIFAFKKYVSYSFDELKHKKSDKPLHRSKGLLIDSVQVMTRLRDFLYGVKTGNILLHKGIDTFEGEKYIREILKDKGLYRKNSISHSLGFDETEFPWVDVLKCVDMPINTPKGFEEFACPQCKDKDLIWIAFSSPAWTWEHLCGRAGPLCICPKCASQIFFICEIMN